MTGPERIARKLDLPVVFLDVRKLERLHYTLRLELITEHPRETAENEITEEYARRLERMIQRDPAYWLWTHKRWKYQKENKE